MSDDKVVTAISREFRLFVVAVALTGYFYCARDLYVNEKIELPLLLLAAACAASAFAGGYLVCRKMRAELGTTERGVFKLWTAFAVCVENVVYGLIVVCSPQRKPQEQDGVVMAGLMAATLVLAMALFPEVEAT